MNKRVALIGDLILDKFINYKSLRLSPEGPAPVVVQSSSFEALGGASNVALSLLNLGLDFKFFFPYNGKTNLDYDKVLKELNPFIKKINTDIQDINPIKTRYYIDGRQYMREDKEGHNLNKISVISKNYIDKIINNSDFILVSDYQKGCLNTDTLQYLINECNKFQKPFFIDTKNKNNNAIKNSFCLKINKAEFNTLFSDNELIDNDSIELIKNKICKAKKTFNIKNLVVTLGSKGSIVATQDDVFYSPSLKVDVIDITGAGDAFLSALIYSFIEDKSENKKTYFDTPLRIENINFANYAASSVVSKKGTVAIDSKLRSRYISQSKNKKIIGFTNGCFDILHIGHLYLIEQSKKYCDYLIVGLNSDESVKRIKGKTRPINDQNFRFKLLQSLEKVDKVIIFSEDTPEKLIKEVKPDVLIKGADYKEEEIIGSSYVKSYGGEVITINFKHTISSTSIVEKIRNL